MSRAETMNIIVRNAIAFPRLDKIDANAEPPNTPKLIIATLLKGYISTWNKAIEANAKMLKMKSKKLALAFILFAATVAIKIKIVMTKVKREQVASKG